MFHNILFSALTAPLSKTNETTRWENRPFTTVWPETQQSKNPSKGPEIVKTIKKKPKRIRTAYTTEQLWALEKTYLQTKYINRDVRESLSRRLKISEKSIKVWFQNRRMKEKKSSEDSSDGSESGSPELYPNISENTEVIHADANSTTEGYNSLSVNIEHSASTFVPQSHQFMYQAPVTHVPVAAAPVNPNYYPYDFQMTPLGESYSNGTSQYEFPDYQLNTYCVNNATTYGRAFFYDTSVYPTEYYSSGHLYNDIENCGDQNVQHIQARGSTWVDSFDENYLN